MYHTRVWHRRGAAGHQRAPGRESREASRAVQREGRCRPSGDEAGPTRLPGRAVPDRGLVHTGARTWALPGPHSRVLACQPHTHMLSPLGRGPEADAGRPWNPEPAETASPGGGIQATEVNSFRKTFLLHLPGLPGLSCHLAALQPKRQANTEAGEADERSGGHTSWADPARGEGHSPAGQDWAPGVSALSPHPCRETGVGAPVQGRTAALVAAALAGGPPDRLVLSCCTTRELPPGSRDSRVWE